MGGGCSDRPLSLLVPPSPCCAHAPGIPPPALGNAPFIPGLISTASAPRTVAAPHSRRLSPPFRPRLLLMALFYSALSSRGFANPLLPSSLPSSWELLSGALSPPWAFEAGANDLSGILLRKCHFLGMTSADLLRLLPAQAALPRRVGAKLCSCRLAWGRGKWGEIPKDKLSRMMR